MIVDGKEESAYDGITNGSTYFSPAGKHSIYMMGKDQKRLVVMDGMEGSEYDGLGIPVFSADDDSVAYIAKKDRKYVVVADGREGIDYDAIGQNGPAFQSDGTLEYLAIKLGILYRVKHAPR